MQYYMKFPFISIVSEIKQDINVSRPVMWRVWLEKWTDSDSTKTQTVPIGTDHLQKFHSVFEDSFTAIVITATQTYQLFLKAMPDHPHAITSPGGWNRSHKCNIPCMGITSVNRA